jgi:phosphatidate cytidylyltransferase
MNELSGSGPSAPGESKESRPGKSVNFSDLGPRVVSAIVLVAAALATLYAGGEIFAVFWLLASVAIHWEWQKLIGGPRFGARLALGGAALAAAAAFSGAGTAWLALLIVAGAAALTAALAEPGRRLWAAGGVLYAGVLVASACMLRESPKSGAIAIAWLFAIVWGTDIFAYFGGRIIGGPKLWPRVSAGKTWSGSIVGVFSGALLGLAVAKLGASAEGSASVPLFLIGLACAVLAQFGDLFESAVKRRFGVKDSSSLIPGHGGVMDRLDGFIFASAFAALLGSLRGQFFVADGLFFW